MRPRNPQLRVRLAELFEVARVPVSAVNRLRGQASQQLQQLRRRRPHPGAQVGGLLAQIGLKLPVAVQIPAAKGGHGIGRRLFAEVLGHRFKRFKHVGLLVVFEVGARKIKHQLGECGIGSEVRHQLVDRQIEQVVVVEFHLKLAREAQFNRKRAHQAVGKLVEGSERNRAVVVQHFTQDRSGPAAKFSFINVEQQRDLFGNGVRKGVVEFDRLLERAEHAVLHFVCGLVGERQAQNAPKGARIVGARERRGSVLDRQAKCFTRPRGGAVDRNAGGFRIRAGHRG